MELERNLECRDYSNRLTLGKIRAFHNALKGFADRLEDGLIIVSSSIESEEIVLRKTGKPDSKIVIQKDEVPVCCAAYDFLASKLNHDETINFRESFSVKVGQVERLTEVMRRVSEYNGLLPFYAETIIINRPEDN